MTCMEYLSCVIDDRRKSLFSRYVNEIYMKFLLLIQMVGDFESQVLFKVVLSRTSASNIIIKSVWFICCKKYKSRVKCK